MLNSTATPLKIAVIGLGYVGLPLAVEFGKEIPVVGFDTSQQRVDELQAGHDRTHETSAEQLAAARLLHCSANPTDLHGCNVFIVTVPTVLRAGNAKMPVEDSNCTRPMLPTPLAAAAGATMHRVMFTVPAGMDCVHVP